MLPVSPVRVDVKPESSCHHWTCCFGCRCWKALNSVEEKQESPMSMTEVETVTRTYERHRHPQESGSVSPPQLTRVMALSPQQVKALNFPMNIGSGSLSKHKEVPVKDEKEKEDEKEEERVCRLHNGTRVYQANNDS